MCSDALTFVTKGSYDVFGKGENCMFMFINMRINFFCLDYTDRITIFKTPCCKNDRF